MVPKRRRSAESSSVISMTTISLTSLQQQPAGRQAKNQRPEHSNNQRLFAFSFVTRNQPILDVNHAMGVLGDVRFVRYQHDGISFFVQVGKQSHDFGAGL